MNTHCLHPGRKHQLIRWTIDCCWNRTNVYFQLQLLSLSLGMVKNDRKKQYELVSSKIQTDGNGKETTEGRKEGETNYLTHFIYGYLGNNRKTLAHS